MSMDGAAVAQPYVSPQIFHSRNIDNGFISRYYILCSAVHKSSFDFLILHFEFFNSKI